MTTERATNLDDGALYEARDPQGMHTAIAGLPSQAREAWEAAQAWPLPEGFRTPRRVVALGMGGSAIGADVLASLSAHWRGVPMQVVRGYTAPPVDDDTLVIASSFSGNTEETLEAFEGVLDGPSMRLVVTSGGRLAELARERGVPAFTYSWQGQPRAALGYSFFPLLSVLQRLGAVPVEQAAVEAAFASLEELSQRWGIEAQAADNEAKQLATRMRGRLPVVFGTDVLEVAARRWAGQANENAKQWALFAALPELDHNIIVGFGAPSEVTPLLHVVLLDASVLHPRNRLRVQLTAEALERGGVSHEVVDAGGDDALSCVLRTCYLGDWASLYLAMLNEADPYPVAIIEWLKQQLAER